MANLNHIPEPILSDTPIHTPCEGDHEYIISERIWPFATVCKKCGHTIIRNLDGSVTEKYGLKISE